MSVHRLAAKLFAISTLKSKYKISNLVLISVRPSLLFTIGHRQRTDAPATGTAIKNWLWSHFTCLFPERRNTSKRSTQARFFLTSHEDLRDEKRASLKTPAWKARFFPGNLFWHSFTNHNTGNYLHHGITLQAIRGFLLHSGETPAWKARGNGIREHG